MRRASFALIAATAALLLVPVALGHAEPLESNPDFGAALDASPDALWIRFTQPVDAATTSFEIVNASLAGFPVGDIAVSEEGRLATATLPEPLPPGSYALKWRVISLTDGHPTRGAIPFTVASDEALIDVDDNVTVDPLRLDAVIGKGFAFVGMAVVVGAFGFWYLVLPRGYRKGHEGIIERVALAGAWLHLLGVVVFAFSQHALSGLDARTYFLQARVGQALLVRTMLGAVIVAALAYAARRPDIPRQVWAATSALAVLTLLVFGVSSHSAGTITPGWLGALTDGVHLIAVGVWFGGLLTFVLFLRALPREEESLTERLRVVPPRFSTVAMWSVGVAAVTGLVMSWSLMGFDVSAYPDSRYGRILALKVLLAFAMIALGAINKFVFVRRYERGGGARSVRAFRENVRREVLIGLIVFLLAAVLTNSAPPAIDAAHERDRDGHDPAFPGLEDEFFVTEATTEHYNWTVTFHPRPALGESTHFIIELFAKETNARDRDASPVRLIIVNHDEPALGETVVTANATARGTYEAAGSYFPVPGHYAVTIEASSGAVGAYREQVTFDFQV